MNPSQLRAKFIEQISKTFPGLSPQQISPLVSEQLLSPFVVELPLAVLQQAQDFVTHIFKERQTSAYKAALQPELSRRNLKTPGNYSIAMSYDFHLDDTQNLQLIEVNTNASFLALGDLMYKAHGLPAPVKGFSLEELKENILLELQLNGSPASKNPRVAIIDDQPEQQKLYLEFLVFSELFRSWGWDTKICDYRQLSDSFDFIYNRYTDFFLGDSSSQRLLQWFNSRKMTFSPNPAEYLFLADKTRMIEWSQKSIPHVPKAQLLTSANAEEVWTNRKNLFFKPRQSFGAKQTYKGAKISHRLFQELIGQDILAQEYIEPSEVSVPTDTGPQDFRYDLRFYAYQDRVQSVVARLYQGQLTNLKTPYGGFACVRFTAEQHQK